MNPTSKFSNIKLIVLDVDGVLTSADILITESGDFLRTMNTKDGYGMKKIINCGIPIAIITGGESKGVEIRLKSLGIKTYYAGVHDKRPILEEIVQELAIPLSQIAYMGDDVPDLPCIEAVGLGCCPADAIEEVKEKSQFISKYKGGRACVRELIDLILQAQPDIKE